MSEHEETPTIENESMSKNTASVQEDCKIDYACKGLHNVDLPTTNEASFDSDRDESAETNESERNGDSSSLSESKNATSYFPRDPAKSQVTLVLRMKRSTTCGAVGFDLKQGIIPKRVSFIPVLSSVREEDFESEMKVDAPKTRSATIIKSSSS